MMNLLQHLTIISELSETGSIIVVVATDAPLLPHQLKRLAGRVSLGIGKNRRNWRKWLG